MKVITAERDRAYEGSDLTLETEGIPGFDGIEVSFRSSSDGDMERVRLMAGILAGAIKQMNTHWDRVEHCHVPLPGALKDEDTDG